MLGGLLYIGRIQEEKVLESERSMEMGGGKEKDILFFFVMKIRYQRRYIFQDYFKVILEEIESIWIIVCYVQR